MNHLARAKSGKALVMLCLIALAIVFAVPLLCTMSTALKSAQEFAKAPDRLIPAKPVLDNFSKAWRALPFPLFVRNTVFVSVTATALQVLSSSLVAYGFARFRFRGRNFLFGLLLATMMLPAQITTIPVFLIWRDLRVVDTFIPLIAPSVFGSAFNVFLLRQFLLGIPHELDEAATLDGAGYLRIWWNVLLPCAGPALATVAVFSFFANWDAFEGPLVYLNTPNNYTLSLGLRMFQDTDGTAAFEQVMAASLIHIVPTIVIFFCAQRYFMKGIAISGLGGR